MPEDYASRARDAGSYRRRSRSPPQPYSRLPGSNDTRPKDGEYYRSREDALSPSRSLNYDDDGEYHEGAGDADGDRGRLDRGGGGGDRYGGARRGDWGRHGGGGGGGRHYDDDDYRGRDRGTSPSGRHNGGYREGQSSRRYNDAPAPAPAPGGKIIILQGIPEDATERDVLYGLNLVTQDPNTSTDQIKIVRFRYDSAGRRLAVVEFKRRADAESFMEQHHPDISFPLEHTRGANSEYITMDIFFERSRSDIHDSRREDEDWDCLKCGAVNFSYRAMCFKCKTERPDDANYSYSYGAPLSGPLLTGETDEDPQQMPSQYLVIRNLEASVTEEVLAKGVMKLFREETAKAPTGSHKLKSTAPGSNTANLGAKPGSLHRVFLIRSRRSNESWRYGFAEFATVEDAKGAVAKFRNSPSFAIASRPVVVSFIHTGVFIPAFEVGPDEDSRFSFQPIYNPTIRLKYWDERVYPSIHVVSVEPTSEPQGAVKSTDHKDGAVENPLARQANLLKKFRKKEPAPGEKGIAMMPQMQMWTKKAAELHGKKLAAAEGGLNSAGFEGDDDDQEPDGPLKPHWADQYLSYADWDRMLCPLCDWEVPSQETINNRGYGPYTREDLLVSHEVIVHNHFKDPETKEKASAKLTSLGKEPRSIARRTPRLKHDAPPVYTSYADFDALYCHLCHRTFKHAETIWRHEQESELHKRMLSDVQAKERAVAELAAKGKVPLTMVPDKKLRREEQRTQRYRDRAMERRNAFLQPNKPGGQLSKQQLALAGASAPAAGGDKRKEQQLQQQAAEEQAAAAAKKSKGAGMLAKMGWTAGVGLGAEGTGRTQAIATEAYAPGVGLGADGGKLGDASEEAARRTKGQFSDFVVKTRDKARERFEKLQE